MERLVTRRLCTFNTNFLFLLRRSKVSCNFILKISKKFSAFKFSPKLWDKPARTALGPFLRLWSTQPFSVLDSSMTSFALVIWAYEQSGSALSTDALCVWHLYVLNALNGLMNTVQQPASEVAVTLLTPKAHYQRTSGLRSFSNSLNIVLTGVLATALLAFDLTTFAVAFLTLLFGIWICLPVVMIMLPFKGRVPVGIKKSTART